MRTLKFWTWLDIRRLILKKTASGNQLPEGITKIDCFSDALEISVASYEDRAKAENILKEWFNDWYQNERSLIQLDLGNTVLPVEFLIEASANSESSGIIHPFWEEVVYTNKNPEEEINSLKNLHLPEPYTTSPEVLAFYSFKGGVGRTTHLAAYLFALLERSRKLEKPITVLVIDADLEAPGLTYWDRTEKQQPAVSFIDFLEVFHYSPLPIEQTLELFAQEVKKSPRYDGRSIFYFLPACIHDEQLLDTPVLPENLARSPQSEWTCGTAIHQLGQALAADYILIDLRAGLSEISGPVIFDPRIQRFFVTTASEQSVAGLSLVLEQMSRVAPSDADIDNSQYYDPSVIVSFLTQELRAIPAFGNALVKFRTSYAQSTGSEEDSIYAKRLDVKETDFAQELLYINNWEEAKSKLSSTSIMRVAREWAESYLRVSNEANTITEIVPTSTLLEDVRKFRDICKRYEFAESGEGEGLLVTEPLKNLATTFQVELPRVVSIGAKGAGKTFIYVQLSRFKYWETFIQVALKEEINELKTHIFPVLQSKRLQDTARGIITSARDEVRKVLGKSIPEFLPSEYEDRIQESLEKNFTDLQWTEFWVNEIARSIGLISIDNTTSSLQDINRHLGDQQARIIFLFDGLEDIFSEAASSEPQKRALKSLMNLPDRLSEIRQSNLGLIILLRRDFLRYAITQNSAQFESLYSSYDLSWNENSFLKLAYWICSQASVIEATEAKIENFEREKIVSELKKLWGEKLGGVREAYTDKWVFAALTDFKGKLQARDIVRFLYNAAKITFEQSKDVQFEKWSKDRLLPPQAIRRALDPCSEKKVEEAKEEYPEFAGWVNKIEAEYTQDQKRIPFTAEDLGLDQSTIRMLEDMGVIYEDKDKDDIARYYMPEIFRAGLKFTLERGKRPRVLVLKRKALA